MTRGQPMGSKRLRGNSWQLRAYAGTAPTTGEAIWISDTIPPRPTPTGPQPVSEDEAKEKLAKLVAHAVTIRDEAKARRKQNRLARLLGDD